MILDHLLGLKRNHMSPYKKEAEGDLMCMEKAV